MRKESMMKWRVRKEDRFGYNEHEDIRRSLEVLDNVLAEFDDCLESLESSNFSHIPFDLSFNLNRCAESERYEVLNKSGEYESPSEVISKDARSSLTLEEDEQDFVSSPPPIPKRSPTTQLSENLNSSSVFLFDDKLSESYDSIGDNNVILSTLKHTGKQISPLSISKKDGDFYSNMNESDKCFKCGQCIFPEKGTDVLKEINYKANSLNNVKHSLQSFNSPKISSDSTSMQVNSDSVYCERKTSPNGNLLIAEFNRSMNCSYKEKIGQLNIKFHTVRELIKQQKIKPLDRSPPSFIPELPSVKNELFEKNHGKIKHKSKLSASVSYPDFRDLIDENMPSFDSLPNHTNLSSDKNNVNNVNNNSSSSLSSYCLRTHSSSLCQKCWSSGQSPTIEDIPNLLPTDVLVRPQFGLSYSLEDDLSPGVKEIQKTSTPKSDVTSDSLFKVKESPGMLSTFSNSASSLGYVSSQSEIELNNLCDLSDKVPMATFKSVTLPNGLDRFPFYSSSQDSSSESIKRHNSQKMPDSKQLSEANHPIPNSSIELLPTDKPKKNVFLFSRFSRKDKKSVKK